MKRILVLHITVIFVLLFCGAPAQAQEERKALREGVAFFEEENYIEAAKSFEKALEVNPGYGKADYNLGNALYRQGQLGQAAEKYEIAAADAFDKGEKSDAHHNIGNCLLNTARHLLNNPPESNDSTETPDPQQLIRASIEAYKEALRLDPGDEDSRYNLTYAKKMLQNGGQGQNDNQQQEQENQQNQDEDKQDSQEDGNQNEEQKNQDGEQDKEKPQEDEGNEPKEGQKPKPNEMSKEEAEQLLKALDQNEKDLQEKMAKDRVNGEPLKIEKDW